MNAKMFNSKTHVPQIISTKESFKFPQLSKVSAFNIPDLQIGKHASAKRHRENSTNWKLSLTDHL